MRPTRTLLLLGAFAFSASCNCGRSGTLVTDKPVLSVPNTALDFGPVQELTAKTLTIHVDNIGKAEMNITAKLDDGASADFALGDVPPTVDPGGFVEVPVVFTPHGAGEDTGSVTIGSDDKDHPTADVTLHGGPIAPEATLSPDPMAFAPVTQPLTSKFASVTNTGLATLHVQAIGVWAQGNPDFSVVPPVMPASVKPGEAVSVEVDYARSTRNTEGKLELHSDDPAGVKYLRLLPDPPKQCADGIDNDGDGLIDFPDDPGCSDPNDDDEYNPPQCIDGAQQPCGMTVGICKQGVRTCAHSVWGGCDGGVAPQAEQCNGLDDDCNGKVDDGITESCTVNACSGARACVEASGVDGGQWSACMPVNSMPETCNGKDDNCNGQIDEGITQSCTVNGCAGSQICVPGGSGTWTTCAPTNPHPEVCNGIDDDCNGQVDDGLGTFSCGVGACLRTAASCVDGGPGVCTPGTPTAEVCNGIDDDCNGGVDDGLGTISCGTGACARTAPACVNGSPGNCTPGAPSAEVCNNIDDNCNGTIDENVTQSCYTGPAGTNGVGACHGGTQTCTAGVFGACTGQVTPAASEICGNGIDDNCNGTVDEGCGGCNVDTGWHIDGGAVVYSCASGLVNINITDMVVSTAGGVTSFAPQPTWSPGATRPMKGPAVCPSGVIDAGVVYTGTCNETYRLQGKLTAPNVFTGVMTMSYSGSFCLDCTTQTFPVQFYH